MRNKLWSLLTLVLSLNLLTTAYAADAHSYAEPEKITIKNVDLDLNVDVEKQTLGGSATLSLDRKDKNAKLVLDSSNLSISAIQYKRFGRWHDLTYTLGKPDPILGQKLEIDLPKKSIKTIKITYTASKDAPGLQWNTSAQTSSKRPFLITNNEPIGARSWIPLQDTPVVRMTYTAKVHVAQPDLMAVMSAVNPTKVSSDGNYSFKMDIPVPSYLVAMAVGKLGFKSTGNRTGVYAEPEVLDKAAEEFSETEKMVEAAESLYGKYVWGRYDLLVLPASYPWGGMENPKLTFVTPTIITGKKDLVDVVAHEISHSWSGNFVTNASWDDVWINEGFTTYVQYRVIEKLRGTPTRMRDMSLDRAELQNDFNDKTLNPNDTKLKTDYAGRSPDDTFNNVPYTKGALFLYAIEVKVGKEKIDEFLKKHFADHKFKSITTEEVVAELSKIVDPEFIHQWINEPYLPASVPATPSTIIDHVAEMAKNFTSKGQVPDAKDIAGLTSKDRCYFIQSMPKDLTTAKLKKLDAVFQFTSSKDPEVLTFWYKLSLPKDYSPTMQTASMFVSSVGRGKYVRPIYKAFAETPKGMTIAKLTYEKNKDFYSPMTRGQIEKILEKKK